MKGKRSLIVILLLSMVLSSCQFSDNSNENTENSESETVKYSESEMARDFGIDVDFPTTVSASSSDNSAETDSNAESDSEDKNSPEKNNTLFRMRVYDSMEIYSSTTAQKPEKVLSDGDIVILKEIEGSIWAEVYYSSGPLMGYAKDGFARAIHENGVVYAELPIEYGMAKTNQETLVPAYSHLVDVRKYFNVYSSTEDLVDAADFSKYDLVVSMKLSTNETTIKEPFYNTNIAMVQYDILPMIEKAVELFRKDGYTMVIYDAYRPTSVQQRWFDVVKVHKWVANPAIGMGGVHDRGTALDISLIDKDGNELEFPTPMHTFTEDSARNSPKMTQKARENMDYMLNVMLQCGFTYINSEWWHFQDVDTKYYLPTDHPIDTLPVTTGEKTEIGNITNK